MLWLLLAAALFMRAFVPTGYMPERSDTGAISVRVCGAGHVLQIPAGKGEAPDAAERAEPPCAFAGLGTPALPPPAMFAPPAPHPIEPALAEAGVARNQPASPLRLPPVRGPPLPA
jgi:hypothetical protein